MADDKRAAAQALQSRAQTFKAALGAPGGVRAAIRSRPDSVEDLFSDLKTLTVAAEVYKGGKGLEDSAFRAEFEAAVRELTALESLYLDARGGKRTDLTPFEERVAAVLAMARDLIGD